MKFSPRVFKNSTMADNKNNPNAGVIFEIFTYNGNAHVKSGTTIIGEKYLLKGTTYVGKANSKLDYLNGKLEFKLDYDKLKAKIVE